MPCAELHNGARLFFPMCKCLHIQLWTEEKGFAGCATRRADVARITVESPLFGVRNRFQLSSALEWGLHSSVVGL